MKIAVLDSTGRIYIPKIKKYDEFSCGKFLILEYIFLSDSPFNRKIISKLYPFPYHICKQNESLSRHDHTGMHKNDSDWNMTD